MNFRPIFYLGVVLGVVVGLTLLGIIHWVRW
jgi:hypothetical protein